MFFVDLCRQGILWQSWETFYPVCRGMHKTFTAAITAQSFVVVHACRRVMMHLIFVLTLTEHLIVYTFD